MADYSNLDEMLSTLEGLTITRSNNRQDDGTDTINGIDWFTFNDSITSNIYVNGNGWIGFGSNSEQLRINRRDQALYTLGYETGVVGYGLTYKYYRIYWKGVSHYSSSISSIENVLEFDVVLLDTGDIYLNIRTFPSTNVSNDNTILSNGSNTSLGTLTTGSRLTFIHQNENGTAYEVATGFIEPLYANVRYLFGDESGTIYTVEENQLIEITSHLTGDVFFNSGVSYIPSEIIKDLKGLKIYKWQDNGEASLAVKVNATPLPQFITCVANMENESIKSIKSITFEASDDVTITWSYDDMNWADERLLKDLTVSDLEQWTSTRMIYFKFKLSETYSTLTSFILTYRN